MTPTLLVDIHAERIQNQGLACKKPQRKDKKYLGFVPKLALRQKWRGRSRWRNFRNFLY